MLSGRKRWLPLLAGRAPALSLEEVDEHILDLAHFGMAIELLFGEDHITVEDHVEHTSVARQEGNSARKKFEELFENVLRQPGGAPGESSVGAVNDRNRGCLRHCSCSSQSRRSPR